MYSVIEKLQDQIKKRIVVSGYTYANIEPSVLMATAPNLTLLNTFAYRISEQGELFPLNDSEVIQMAKPFGAAPVMAVANLDEEWGFDSDILHGFLQNSEAQARMIDEIENQIKTKGLNGVDFDFEYVYSEDRQPYVDFVNQVRNRLGPQGYIVSAALAAKTSADQRGLLYEGHDYRQMGEAADLILIMTYDWGNLGGPPLAVSPVNEVRKVLDFAVTQIPPERILLGMPNYGYDWELPYVSGESQVKSVSIDQAQQLARSYQSPIQYDAVSQAPYFNYVNENGTEHVVWFENEKSTWAKLALVGEYDLAGVGYWNIMKYYGENWSILRTMYDVIKLI